MVLLRRAASPGVECAQQIARRTLWTVARYDGPERRGEPQELAFERAVREATAAAAQQVSRIHRIRLVTQSFFAALTVSALVATGVGFAFKDAASRQARMESVANCRLVKGLSMAMGDFVQSDANVRNAQARANVVVRVARDLHLPARDISTLERANRANYAVAQHWTGVDKPRLDTLARVNCASGLP